MSSTGGGIVVRPGNATTPTQWFSTTDTETIIGCLTAGGHDDLAAKLQAILDASS